MRIHMHHIDRRLFLCGLAATASFSSLSSTVPAAASTDIDGMISGIGSGKATRLFESHLDWWLRKEPDGMHMFQNRYRAAGTIGLFLSYRAGVLGVKDLMRGMDLSAFTAASRDTSLPMWISERIALYLSTLPGYEFGRQKQAMTTRDQHGYVQLMLTGFPAHLSMALPQEIMAFSRHDIAWDVLETRYDESRAEVRRLRLAA
jgi:hypothetical protein